MRRKKSAMIFVAHIHLALLLALTICVNCQRPFSRSGFNPNTNDRPFIEIPGGVFDDGPPMQDKPMMDMPRGGPEFMGSGPSMQQQQQQLAMQREQQLMQQQQQQQAQLMAQQRDQDMARQQQQQQLAQQQLAQQMVQQQQAAQQQQLAQQQQQQLVQQQQLAQQQKMIQQQQARPIPAVPVAQTVVQTVPVPGHTINVHLPYPMLVSGMAVGTPVIVQSNDTTHGVPQQPADPLSQSQGSVGGKRTKGKTSVSKVNQLDKMAAMDSVESVEQAKPPTPTTQAPATTPANQADDSGVHKRDCLVGDCSPGAQKSMAICRGKECQTNLLHTLGKERRHADGKSSHVTTETTQGTTSKTQVTVIAEKHSASDSANDIVCQLNNIPRVSDCVRNQHWKEIVKQPIECGAKKREWQCYCGFFDE